MTNIERAKVLATGAHDLEVKIGCLEREVAVCGWNVGRHHLTEDREYEIFLEKLLACSTVINTNGVKISVASEHGISAEAKSFGGYQIGAGEIRILFSLPIEEVIDILTS